MAKRNIAMPKTEKSAPAAAGEKAICSKKIQNLLTDFSKLRPTIYCGVLLKQSFF